MPIYVGGQSADVWANQHLFELAPDGPPLFVSGVPPDLFSATGQLWGSPLYDWKVRADAGRSPEPLKHARGPRAAHLSPTPAAQAGRILTTAPQSIIPS